MYDTIHYGSPVSWAGFTKILRVIYSNNVRLFNPITTIINHFPFSHP
jgi:hypothetical protein